jgi:hypothetical protein
VRCAGSRAMATRSCAAPSRAGTRPSLRQMHLRRRRSRRRGGCLPRRCSECTPRCARRSTTRLSRDPGLQPGGLRRPGTRPHTPREMVDAPGRGPVPRLDRREPSLRSIPPGGLPRSASRGDPRAALARHRPGRGLHRDQPQYCPARLRDRGRHPKSEESERVIALDNYTIAVLRAHRARQDAERLRLGRAYRDDGLVFAKEDGSPLHPEYVSRHLRVLIKRAGVPAITFHQRLAALTMRAAGRRFGTGRWRRTG